MQHWMTSITVALVYCSWLEYSSIKHYKYKTDRQNDTLISLQVSVTIVELTIPSVIAVIEWQTMWVVLEASEVDG